MVQKTNKVANETGMRETPVSKDLVVFPIPNGFVPPNGVQPGQSFDAVCRVNFQKGQMFLEAIEGHEVRLASNQPKMKKANSFEDSVEEGLAQKEASMAEIGGDEGMA